MGLHDGMSIRSQTDTSMCRVTAYPTSLNTQHKHKYTLFLLSPAVRLAADRGQCIFN